MALIIGYVSVAQTVPSEIIREHYVKQTHAISPTQLLRRVALNGQKHPFKFGFF